MIGQSDTSCGVVKRLQATVTATVSDSLQIKGSGYDELFITVTKVNGHH